MSNSLGVPLLPKTIDCEDYESTLRSADSKDVLKKWYKLDKEAQPQCYVLQGIEQHVPNLDVCITAVTFFRDAYFTFYGTCVLFLQDKNEVGKEKALKDWNNEVENILQILVSSFNQELRDTYLTTTVEQV